MLKLHALLPYLRHLSPMLRWGIGTLAFLFCLLLFLPAMLSPFDRLIIILLMLPVAYVAWFLPLRPASFCISVIVMLFFLVLFLLGRGLLFFPLMVFGAVIFFVETCAIRGTHLALQLAVQASQKTKQAELQMTQASERLQNLNDLKDQFLLNISHELRTPLTEVRGYIDLLQENHAHLDIETRVEFLEHAAHGCNELELLVDIALEATHLESGRATFELASIPLGKCALAMLDRINLQGHEVHIDIPDTMAVWANWQHVERILGNILSNALKYSPAATTVTISATLISENGVFPHVCVRVQDAGPGVQAADMPNLFQKAVRLKRDMTGSVRGTGLGLYISKQLVEVMGGRIWVESTGIPGQGSCFCFTLPAVK
ncbi:sensor histidine kinase [Dictyobacter arantiisoli]|uniref:histidine kinase n=1 Tax=Dictyobacter arantiisoli TaxID=2014874 RepID=A0A5A5THQ1_9CHLR|nr:HAMP domain-containing sensor histidine kinase [Dictyobacter arantiisoli]GCF11111.1 hypothetical protein KDI_46750 [Dictyobacter arantiisoli]